MSRAGLMRRAGWMQWRRTQMPSDVSMCGRSVVRSQVLMRGRRVVPSRMRRMLVRERRMARGWRVMIRRMLVWRRVGG